MEETHEVTHLLGLAQNGDAAAREALLNICYDELHRIARRQAFHERKNHSLQPTALLNEVYLKLFGAANIQWQNRSHFFAIAARQMRRVLVDYARTRAAGKRGGNAVLFSLEDADGAGAFNADRLLIVHEALEQLEALDPHLVRLVEYKYFAGMTDEEIAEVLGISFAQVRRDWAFARTWLRDKFNSDSPIAN